MNAREMKNAGSQAMRHAAKVLGLKYGIAATCRDGFAGYGWYAWPSKDAAAGAVFLPKATILPRHFTSDLGAATETTLKRRTVPA